MERIDEKTIKPLTLEEHAEQMESDGFLITPTSKFKVTIEIDGKRKIEEIPDELNKLRTQNDNLMDILGTYVDKLSEMDSRIKQLEGK